MEHTQLRKACKICGRPFIIDIFSVGSPHQFVQAVTSEECVKAAGGRIMPEGEVEIIDIGGKDRPQK